MQLGHIYNSESFKMRGDTVFVFDKNNPRIENLALVPYDDQFGFHSGDLLADLGHKSLEQEIDPFGLSRASTIGYKRVEMAFTNKENVPILSSYGSKEFD